MFYKSMTNKKKVDQIGKLASQAFGKLGGALFGLIADSTFGFCVTDYIGNIIYLNDSLGNMSGYGDSALGANVDILIPEGMYDAKMGCPHTEVMTNFHDKLLEYETEGGIPESVVRHLRAVTMKSKDGSLLPIYVSVSFTKLEPTVAEQLNVEPNSYVFAATIIDKSDVDKLTQQLDMLSAAIDITTD